jgi:hypothetical protein
VADDSQGAAIWAVERMTPNSPGDGLWLQPWWMGKLGGQISASVDSPDLVKDPAILPRLRIGGSYPGFCPSPQVRSSAPT